MDFALAKLHDLITSLDSRSSNESFRLLGCINEVRSGLLDYTSGMNDKISALERKVSALNRDMSRKGMDSFSRLHSMEDKINKIKVPDEIRSRLMIDLEDRMEIIEEVLSLPKPTTSAKGKIIKNRVNKSRKAKSKVGTYFIDEFGSN